MPFDFAPAKLTAADRRALALSAFHAAIACPDRADWQGIAADLAACLPAVKAPAPVAADLGEWCEYPAAAHKGKGGTFEANRQAEIMFADMTVIRVSLGHKKGKPLPDWARAVRCAVAFYRAQIGTKMRRGFKMDMAESEAYAAAIELPEIVLGLDMTRAAEVDLARANAETADLRRATKPLQTVKRPCDWTAPMSENSRNINRFAAFAQSKGPDAVYSLITSPDAMEWALEWNAAALDDHHQRLAA